MKRNMSFFRRFWVEESCRSENISEGSASGVGLVMVVIIDAIGRAVASVAAVPVN